jgi:hypothetical protein
VWKKIHSKTRLAVVNETPVGTICSRHVRLAGRLAARITILHLLIEIHLTVAHALASTYIDAENSRQTFSMTQGKIIDLKKYTIYN